MHDFSQKQLIPDIQPNGAGDRQQVWRAEFQAVLRPFDHVTRECCGRVRAKQSDLGGVGPRVTWSLALLHVARIGEDQVDMSKKMGAE